MCAYLRWEWKAEAVACLTRPLMFTDEGKQEWMPMPCESARFVPVFPLKLSIFKYLEQVRQTTCLRVCVCLPFGMCENTCLCMHVSLSLCVCVCVCLRGPFGLAKTSAPSYVRGLVWHLGNILYPALQHYTQFTAKGHYVPVNPLLIDISANSTTSQPHDRSLPPQNQEIAGVKNSTVNFSLLSVCSLLSRCGHADLDGGER